jgi:hypothetical protein
MADARDDDVETLTLVNAELWPLAGGDGVGLAAVRIPLSSVTSWWAGSGQRLKARTEWSFGFGIIAPIGEG